MQATHATFSFYNRALESLLIKRSNEQDKGPYRAVTIPRNVWYIVLFCTPHLLKIRQAPLQCAQLVRFPGIRPIWM